MNENTARALNALNLRFYRDSAAAFAESRSAPWPGWNELLPLLRGRASPTILDAGCGNGRFARFLRTALGAPFLYCGIDASAPLLELARRELAGVGGARLLLADLVLEPAERALPDLCCDFVVGFGLLHHIPGEARRRDLLHALAARVAPGGFLALTFWDFARDPRFADRTLQDAAADFAGELDPGDALLRWGPEGSGQVRYCHHSDEAEQARLLADLPLAPRLAFSSDGRSGQLNRYRVLQRR